MMSNRPRCIVLGVGNPDRGDDAAGRVVARDLRSLSLADVAVIEHDGEATALFAQFDGAAAAFVVDASASGAAPGTIRRFDVSAAPLPDLAFGLSTHGFGLAMATELARALGQLPPRCIIYTIEGGSFQLGASLSAPVATAVAAVVQRLRAELNDQGEGADSYA
jgi:hydrogenase maturation protease